MDALIKVDRGGLLVLGKHILDSGATATSATITNAQVRLLKPGAAFDTSDPLQDWTNATVATDGTISYSVSAAQADDLGENYRAEWRYTADSRTHYRDQLWHVVTTVLNNRLTAADIDAQEPWLATFSDITAAQKNGYLQQAFEDVWVLLKGSGKYPWRIFNAEDVGRAVLHLALHKLCLGQMRQDGDHWHVKAGAYYERFQTIWKSLPVVYADDLDGGPDRMVTGGSVRLSRV